MATHRKRQTSSETSTSPTPSEHSTTSSQELTHSSPLASSSIAITLVGFTLAMLALPLGTYFITVDRLFKGNATAAGALAAFTANLVLVGYVYLAWREDQAEQLERKSVSDERKEE